MNAVATANPTRILIVDDHPLLRTGVAQLVEDEPDLELVGEAGSGEQGLTLADTMRPDLLLLDLNMRGMSGVETLKALRAAPYPGRVVVLTVSDSDEDLIAALRAGADGYLLKDMEPDALVDALRRAADGETVIAEQLTPVLAQAICRERDTDHALLDQLTARELKILRYLARGLPNKAIARQLTLAEGTVKVHVKHILRKLQLRSRVEAAIWAVEHGLR